MDASRPGSDMPASTAHKARAASTVIDTALASAMPRSYQATVCRGSKSMVGVSSGFDSVNLGAASRPCVVTADEGGRPSIRRTDEAS